MIVIPALHPAREVTTLVERIEPGQVHRALRTLDAVGGKSINVARFVGQMGLAVRLIALADERLASMLREDPDLGGGDSRALEIVPSPVPSRTDLTVVEETGAATVINGSAPDPGRAAIDALVARTTEAIAADDLLVLAGSLPGGTSGVLEELIRAAHARSARVIVDASASWLDEALAAGPDIVKVNADEARSVRRLVATAGDAAAPRGPSRDEAERPPGFATPAVVAVTEGAEGLRAWIGPDGWRVVPPRGRRLVNPVGAGDAVTAGIAIGLDDGRDAIDALVLGTAMAAARLEHLECRVHPPDVAELLSGVTVLPLR